MVPTQVLGLKRVTGAVVDAEGAVVEDRVVDASARVFDPAVGEHTGHDDGARPGRLGGCDMEVRGPPR
jgi:hypothetical protein